MAAHEETVQLPDGPRLALRRSAGPGRPFLLVHGLPSNARTWDGVASRLVAAGHEVVAVDQRGHGHSEQMSGGYTTEQCAGDLAQLIALLGFTGDRAPVVAGHSWGGNVGLSLAAQHGLVPRLAPDDGGWIKLSDRFATFDDCWAALAPPRFDATRADDLRGWMATAHPDWSPEGVAGTLANFELLDNGAVRPWLARENHREIVRSLFEGDPAALFPRVDVPVLLVPVVGDPPGAVDLAKRAAVGEAEALLPDASVRWYPGADHDVHVQKPDELTDDLLQLLARVEERDAR
jgi:pimeloyl-ACP methyl ester carboxylesterase